MDIRELSKEQVENGQFRLSKVKVLNKARKYLNTCQLYILHFENKRFYFNKKSEINKSFRELLKKLYPHRWFIDYPDSYFKRYVHKEYLKGKKQIEKIRIKKEKYYKKRAIEFKKDKIKKLYGEIKRLESEIKEEGIK